MAKKEYKNILLRDTGFYISDSAYVNTLRKYGIDTVGKILDKKLMERVIGETANMEVKRELSGLKKLIEYKYLDKPLDNDNLLAMKINTFTLINKDLLFSIEDKRISCNDLFKALLLEVESPGYMISSIILSDEDYQKQIRSSNLLIVDLLDLILNSDKFKESLKYRKWKTIKNIIEASIESYDKKNGIVREKKPNEDGSNLVVYSHTLKILRKKITEVISISKELGIKIDELTIEELAKQLDAKEGNFRR